MQFFTVQHSVPCPYTVFNVTVVAKERIPFESTLYNGYKMRKITLRNNKPAQRDRISKMTHLFEKPLCGRQQKLRTRVQHLAILHSLAPSGRSRNWVALDNFFLRP